MLWLLARRSRREVTWDEAVQKMDKQGDEQDASPTVVAPVVSDDITDAPLSEQEHEQEKSVAELVEQADMFVGYADYVQARSSLEQARSLEPDNSLVAYKLLFVLYKQHQTEEFIELAEEVPFESDSYEWTEIKQWGRELAPAHSLFAEQKTEPVTVEDDSTVIEAETDAEADAESQQVEDEAESGESDHLEFNLNDFADSESEVEPEKETSSDEKPVDELDDDLLSFDTNYSFDEKVETVDTESEIEPLELDISEEDERKDTLSFEENNEALSVEPESIDDPAEEAESDFSTAGDDEPDLEFDIGDLDEIDEAETKLDLAAAYVDMGDPDGARSILNEVLVEGNDEQKNRAQELLNSLA